MNIYYIINTRIPTEKAYGYEDAKMCEVMGESGHEIKMIAPYRRHIIKDDVFGFYHVRKVFSIKYLKTFDFFLFEKFLKYFSFYLNSFFFLLRLVFFKIDKNAIIFTRMTEIAWLFCKKNHKTIFECHEWFGRSERISLYFLRDCDHIITTNKYIKQKFIDFGFSENKILVATNGVDLNKFHFTVSKEEVIQNLNLEEDISRRLLQRTILLYAGSYKTMNVEKGIDEILAALQILNNENLFFVAIGGSAKDIRYYQEMAKKVRVEKQSFFIGRKDQSTLALWQKAADILLAPFPDKAHYRFFMTPLKIFEYMAAERPIIASDLPSIKEILNEKNCLFCRPGDASDLAIKIKTLLQNKVLGSRLAAQAFLDVKKYDWKCRADKILEFINN